MEKVIDLSGKKGVTIYFKLKNVVRPFFIRITGENGQGIFYYRKFDKRDLQVNLPVHPDRILVSVQGAEIDQYLVSDLKKQNIPYKYNERILVKRPYSVEQITTRTLPIFQRPEYDNQGNVKRMLLDISPARFLPSIGEIQYNESICKGLPQPVIDYIGRHELGHYYYGRPIPQIIEKGPMKTFYMNQLAEDESEADRFALYSFINSGYNFSGALLSLTDYLSDNYISKHRMQKQFDEIIKMHKHIKE